MGSVIDTNGVRDSANLTKPAQALAEIQERYKREHDKRLRGDGRAQFADLYDLPKFKHFKQDPWADAAVYDTLPRPSDGDRDEIIIMGTGIAALTFAVRFIEAGYAPQDLRLIDVSAGFGGTWYWNRYPGLMCDVESYIYLPLLEETGYMPKRKYASGAEIREQCERIATQYGLHERTWFRTRMEDAVWDDTTKEWVVRLAELRQGDQPEHEMVTVRSRFVILTTGLMLIPQVPKIKGVESFAGDCFHAARWNYNATGGTPENPALEKLRDKKVALIGTGASSIQVVPDLAKYAKELYVFQRTPSAVDFRANRDTDPEEFKKFAAKPGWQSERSRNFASFMNNADPKPAVDMVNDAWTTMLSYSAAAGSAMNVEQTPEAIQEYYKYLNELDLERQSKVRDRVDVVVKDPVVASKLKPWYPGWCKRPCFHDEYLEAFNLPNVTLVDTDGKGVDEITPDALIANGEKFDVDMLILGTGYKSPFLYSPPGRVGVQVLGRNGVDLDKKWTSACTTLHGLMSHDFPNMFWPGFIQAGGNPNYTYICNVGATQVAYLMRTGLNEQEARNGAVQNGSNGANKTKASPYKSNFTVETTADAEEAWVQRILSQAHKFGASAGCTPSYINAEGEFEGINDPKELGRLGRNSIWGQGQLDYDHQLEEFRQKGDHAGVEITATL